MTEKIFPFTAVVGRDLAKRSLVYHAIEPQLGGTVFMGHRGCAKSTLVRAFQEILPPFENSKDDSSTLPDKTPFIEVPIGVTEDRLLGAVDIESLTEHGNWKIQPGLLEMANHGVLYIDEVNLLPDHIVDVILDAATVGSYRLERDGISRRIESRFILIGTMNPEEGDLRPQLLDRFTHCVMIHDNYTTEQRREIVRMRMQFEDDPEFCLQQFSSDQNNLWESIVLARKLIKEVEIDEEVRNLVAVRAGELDLEGVRAELGVLRTARSAAAWKGEKKITKANIEEGWALCLAHRLPQYQMPPMNTPNNNSGSYQNEAENPGEMSSSLSTSSTPKDVRQGTVKLDSNGENNQVLREWWNLPVPSPKYPILGLGSSLTFGTRFPGARFDWPRSVLESLKGGWSPGEGLRIQYRKLSRRPLIWIFIDASRSAGALRFLGGVLDAIQNLRLKQAARRFQILLLQHNRIDWCIKRGTAQSANFFLDSIKEASGRSYLHQALLKLSQAIQKTGVLPDDRVLFCSDGMFTPEKGESLPDAKLRFHKRLHWLSQRIPGMVWLHPVPKRGMRNWILQLVAKAPVKMIEV